MNLTIKNIQKTYSNGVHALKGIELDISAGMFGLLGPNGAGKTSLMNTLATLQKPDSGDIYLGETDLIVEPQKVRERLGYLPQQFGVYPNTSAEQMLDYIAQLKGVDDKKQRNLHVAELLELVNLSEHKKRNLDTYSGGMRQRFGIAQALIGSPKLIIVDEPTAGLDPVERNRFHNILSDISTDTIVILSTHIVEDIANLCHHMAILYRGEVLKQSSPHDLVNALKGKLWEKSVDKGEIEEMQKNGLKVLSTRLSEGQHFATVKSNTCPGDGYTTAEPDLEDVYFDTLPQDALQ